VFLGQSVQVDITYKPTPLNALANVQAAITTYETELVTIFHVVLTLWAQICFAIRPAQLDIWLIIVTIVKVVQIVEAYTSHLLIV
jgi:hypothetical protein